MEEIIIYGILAVALVAAVVATVRHFKGQGGCCGGGGDYRPKKKKLAKVIQVRRFQVEGMHCQKCSDRVMEAINDIPHVAATVDLKQGIATVRYEEDVEDQKLLEKLQRLGYRGTRL